ncbi:MAG: hypothetical protein ACRDSZ_06590 [Pseudonocardiaceae bacterium]
MTVTGSALPVDEAAAACAHVEELARAAKRAGHPGRIGPLRADIYLGLLDGRWQHRNRDQIIADLLTRATRGTDDGANLDNPADPDHLTDPPAGDDVPAGDAPTDSAGTNRDGTSTAGGPGPLSEGMVFDGTVSEGPAQLARRVGVELRVGLSTLLGRDRHPGEVAGWGSVTAQVAGTVVTAQRSAEWRYALTDPAVAWTALQERVRRQNEPPLITLLSPLSSGSVVVAHRDANDAVGPAGRRELGRQGQCSTGGRPELMRGRCRSWRGARRLGARRPRSAPCAGWSQCRAGHIADTTRPRSLPAPSHRC